MNPKSACWKARCYLVPLLFLLLALSYSFRVVPSAQARLDPLLVQLAQAQPQTPVAVIVQKSVADDRVERAVTQLGGEIVRRFTLINAFAAELQAADTLQLARADGVSWISLDAPVQSSGGPDGIVDDNALRNVYNRAIDADRLWAKGYQGSPVTVAVVDSGWMSHEDFRETPSGGQMRLLARAGFSGAGSNLTDQYGHGVHIAGIIGGNGSASDGEFIGVAPKVQFVSVKVNDKVGEASMSDLIDALQWVYDNRLAYNIRVVNLSMNATLPESYRTSPLNAAMEVLWFNQIVVVVSAGNNGSTNSGVMYPPANDPFVITVGAVDDRGTPSVNDDVLASYSAYGQTLDGFAKPDIVAPGHRIVAPLSNVNAVLAREHPANLVNGTDYFRMSGTSMAAAVASGAVALMLQVDPSLTPDQVKYRLVNFPSRAIRNGDRLVPYLNAYNAATSKSTSSANTGLLASPMLWTGSEPPAWNSVSWNSVSWNSVSWNSVSWNSVSWNSVSWNSVSWNSEYWGP